MKFYYNREELDGMDLITVIPKDYWNEHNTIQDFSVSELEAKMLEYGGFECMEGCYEADDMDDFEGLLREDPDFEENTELGLK